MGEENKKKGKGRPKKEKQNHRIEPMPKIILNNITAKTENVDQEKEETPEQQLARLRRMSENKAKVSGWLYLLVIGVGSIILFIWAWAIFAKISVTNFRASPEKKFIQQSREQWDEIWGNLKPAEQTNEVREKITEIIGQLKNIPENQISTSTAVISSSTQAVSTSTQL